MTTGPKWCRYVSSSLRWECSTTWPAVPGSLGPALAFTAMLASVPMLNIVSFELAGYVDVALALYLLAAAGFLYFWWREGNRFDLTAASMAATAAAWTKNEGQFFLLAVMLLGAAGLSLSGRSKKFDWLLLLGPPTALLLPWTVLRAGHGVQAAGFTMGFNFDPKLFSIAVAALVLRFIKTYPYGNVSC